MTFVVRGQAADLRSSGSFGLSALVHGTLLGILIVAPKGPTEPRQSIYDQKIRPYEHRLVWYHFRERLPEIRPAQTVADARPPRAARKFNQPLVAGPNDAPRPAPLIVAPTPEAVAPPLQPLPNVLAVAPPKAVRKFTAPQQKEVPADTPALPDAPHVAAPALDRAAAAAAPQPAPVRSFTAPAPRPRSDAPLVLPDAPSVSASVDSKGIPALPGGGLQAPLRSFSAPQPSRPAATGPSALPDAPALDAASPNPSGATLAIVSLNPAKSPDLPAPPPSHAAGFSGGPKIRPEGSAGSAGDPNAVVIPGLTASGGAKDAQPTIVASAPPVNRQTLMAAIRPAAAATLPMPPAAPAPAIHVAAAPDPILDGRIVYTIAIQMPNITSHSGSWMVWFAERDAVSGPPPEMRAPVPLRKVDPKYVASAVADHIEGVVRLAAVIRKSGAVDTVKLLRHLDERLDRTAAEALAKWQFEPAKRNGVPVDVDAVFEVPFRLTSLK